MSAKLACVLLMYTVPTSLPQSEDCGIVYPESYSYLNGSFSTLEPTTLNNCSVSRSIEAQVYLTCTSSILTDGNPGPANFSGTDNEDYYIWDNSEQNQQMLFTFTRHFSLTAIKIQYYYYGNGRPKLRFYLVEEGFQVWNTTTDDHTSITFDNARLSQNNTGREVSLKQVSGVTSKILLVSVFDKNYKTILSEVTFRTDGTYVCNIILYDATRFHSSLTPCSHRVVELPPPTLPDPVSPAITTHSVATSLETTPTSSTNQTPTTTTSPQASSELLVGGILGGLSAAVILIVAVVVTVLILWHLKQPGSTDSAERVSIDGQDENRRRDSQIPLTARRGQHSFS